MDMGFLKKLFGSKKEPAKYVDKRGVYFYVRCDNCGTITRVRADKEYDLIRDDNGFVWHKSIVDNRCFRPMVTVVQLDGNYQPTSEEISGGSFVSEKDYDTFLKPEASAELDDVGDATDLEVDDQ
jgi:hypothetical protein